MRGSDETRHLVSQVCVTFFLDFLSLGASLSLLGACAEALLAAGAIGRAHFAAFGLLVALAPWGVGPAWNRVAARSSRRLTCASSGLCRGLGLGLVAFALMPATLAVASTLWAVSAGGVAISTACIAELLPFERRAAGFGLLVAAVSLGLSAGMHLGHVIGEREIGLALWLCSLLSIAGAVYAWACLPGARVAGRGECRVGEERRWA